MAEKKEAFGLSLLDVLSNALLGGIVLMMISAITVNIANMRSDLDKDDIQGEADINTAKQFAPVDKFIKSDSMLICSFEMKGGDTARYTLEYNSDDIDLLEQVDDKSCINISRGVYRKQFWLVTRECALKSGRWYIGFKTGDPAFLPDSIFYNVNVGVRPINTDRWKLKTRLRYNSDDDLYILLSITENGLSYPSTE